MTTFPRARTIRFNEVQSAGPGVGYYAIPQPSFPSRGATFVRAKRWNETGGAGHIGTGCKYCGGHSNFLTTSTPSGIAKKHNAGGLTDLSMISHIASKPYDSFSVTPAKPITCSGCTTYEKQLQDEVTARRILEDRVRLLMHENTSIRADIEQNVDGIVNSIPGRPKNMETFTAELIDSLQREVAINKIETKITSNTGKESSSSDRRLTFISSKNVSAASESRIANLDSLPASSSDEFSSDDQQMSSPEKPSLMKENEDSSEAKQHPESNEKDKVDAVSSQKCSFCSMSEQQLDSMRMKLKSMESNSVPSETYARLEREFEEIQEFLNSLEKELEPLHETSSDNGEMQRDHLREEIKCNLSLLREQVQSTADEMSRATEEAENAKLSKSDLEMKLQNLKQNFEYCKRQNASLKEDVRDWMEKCCVYLKEKIDLQDNLRAALAETTELNTSNIETLNEMGSLKDEVNRFVESYESVRKDNEFLQSENEKIDQVCREQEVNLQSQKEDFEQMIELKERRIIELAEINQSSLSKLSFFEKAVKVLVENHQKIVESFITQNESLTIRLNEFNSKCESLHKNTETCHKESYIAQSRLREYEKAFEKIRSFRHAEESSDMKILQLLLSDILNLERNCGLLEQKKIQLEAELSFSDETHKKIGLEFESTICEMQANVEKLESQVDCKNSEINDLKAELEDREAELRNNNQELFIKSDQISRLSEQVESLETMVSELSESKANLVNQVTTTDRTLQSMKQENSEILNVYQQLKVEIQHVTEKHQLVECEKEEIFENLRELRSQIKESDSIIKELNLEIDSKCEELKIAEERRKKLQLEVSEVTGRYESEKAINTSLADKADEAYVEIEKLHGKVKDLERSRAQLLSQEKDAESIIEALRAQLNEARDKLSGKAQEVDELKLALHNLNEEVNRRKSIEVRGTAEVEIWKSRVHEAEEKLNQSVIPLQNENRILYEKIAEMQNVIRDLEEATDFKDYKEAFEKLAEERVVLQDEIDAKNAKLEKLRKEVTDLQGKLLSREVQLNVASSECQKKTLKVETMEKHLNEMEIEWAEKHEEATESLNKIIAKLREENLEVADKLYHVTAELESTQSELETTTSRMLSVESEKEDVSAALGVKKKTNDEIVKKIYEIIRVITKLELKVGIGNLSDSVKELEMCNVLNELDSSRDRLSLFEQYISEQGALLEDKENEIITITSKYNELKTQMSVFQNDEDVNFQINEDFHRWQRKYDQLYAENQKLLEEYDKLKKSVEPFKDVLDCYDAEKRLLLEKSHSTEHQYEQLANRYADLLGHQNHKQKIRHINKLKCDNFRLKKENDALREEISVYNNDLKNFVANDMSKLSAPRVLKTSATQNVFSSSNQFLSSFDQSTNRLADVAVDLATSAISSLAHHSKVAPNSDSMSESSCCTKENSESNHLSS